MKQDPPRAAHLHLTLTSVEVECLASLYELRVHTVLQTFVERMKNAPFYGSSGTRADCVQ